MESSTDLPKFAVLQLSGVRCRFAAELGRMDQQFSTGSCPGGHLQQNPEWREALPVTGGSLDDEHSQPAHALARAQADRRAPARFRAGSRSSRKSHRASLS